MTVYQYLLTYEGQFSFTQLFGQDPVGVCHADDLIYLWNPIFQSGDKPILGPLTNEDATVRDIMISAWTNFAIYGDPTPPDSDLSWTPLAPDSEHQYWNIFGSSPVMATSQELQERMALWDKVLA